MPTCLIDARCLQDINYRGRGIGRHARSLVRHAGRSMPGVTLCAVLDRDLPALDAADAAYFDQIRFTAYAGALSDRCSFVQLSPMTHDPLLVAPLLQRPGWRPQRQCTTSSF